LPLNVDDAVATPPWVPKATSTPSAFSATISAILIVLGAPGCETFTDTTVAHVQHSSVAVGVTVGVDVAEPVGIDVCEPVDVCVRVDEVELATSAQRAPIHRDRADGGTRERTTRGNWSAQRMPRWHADRLAAASKNVADSRL
jgi:hypothetical protein